MPVWTNRIDRKPTVAVTIISIALLLAIGFLMTRITKLPRLPNVTACIVGRTLAEPFCLNLVPKMIVDGTSFLSDIALAFIAFSIGEYFRVSSLKKNGGKVFTITVLESCGMATLVFLVCHFVSGLNFGLLYRTRRPCRRHCTCLHHHDHPADRCKKRFCRDAPPDRPLDDVVGLALYSIAVSVVTAVFPSSGFQIGNVLIPLANRSC